MNNVYLLKRNLKIESVPNDKELIALLRHECINVYDNIKDAQKMRDYLDTEVKIN